MKLGLAPNTVLIVAPLVIAGLLMLWRHERSRHYIEADVEWWTLLFFMMLFAVAGTLEETRVTQRIAGYFQQTFGSRLSILTPMVIGTSAIGSAFVDNIVFVAAFMPVVEKLQQTPLLWALLQGTCLGGNITMIGSTANIVALGMLEKRYRTHVHFLEWLKVGLVVGAISCLIAWGGVVLLSPYMPTVKERQMHRQVQPKESQEQLNVMEMP
jgi:Na+/H+ antiporter NhaD/arsenite permease-like protein